MRQFETVRRLAEKTLKRIAMGTEFEILETWQRGGCQVTVKLINGEVTSGAVHEFSERGVVLRGCDGHCCFIPIGSILYVVEARQC